MEGVNCVFNEPVRENRLGVLYFYHWGFIVSPIRQALDEFCVLFMGEYSVE